MPAPYFQDPAVAEAIRRASSVPERVEAWRRMRVRALENAAALAGPFPLVVFSPGFGMARSFYTAWVEELASRGFVVAVVDHPFAGVMAVDGRSIETEPHPEGPRGHTTEMARDVGFLLPTLVRLEGVDPERIATLGHSIGGAAALEACRLWERIRACVNLDGAPFGEFAETGVGRPFLVLHQRPVFPGARDDGELARRGREAEREWQQVLSRQTAPALRLSVRGTGHFSFSDALFLRPELVAEGGGQVAEPLLVLRTTTDVVEDYLRRRFAGDEDVALELPPLVSPARLGTLGEGPGTQADPAAAVH